MKNLQKKKIITYLLQEQQYYEQHQQYDKHDLCFRSFDYCELLANDLQIPFFKNNLTYWLKPIDTGDWI